MKEGSFAQEALDLLRSWVKNVRETSTSTARYSPIQADKGPGNLRLTLAQLPLQKLVPNVKVKAEGPRCYQWYRKTLVLTCHSGGSWRTISLTREQTPPTWAFREVEDFDFCSLCLKLPSPYCHSLTAMQSCSDLGWPKLRD